MTDEETVKIWKEKILQGVAGLQNIDVNDLKNSKDLDGIIKGLFDSNPGLLKTGLDKLNEYYLRVHIKTALMLSSLLTGLFMVVTAVSNILNVGWMTWLGAGAILTIAGAIPLRKIFRKKEGKKSEQRNQ